MRKIGLISNTGSIPLFLQKQLAYSSHSDILRITGGNTGNVCFVQATEKLLGFDFQQIDWNDDPSVIQNSISHIVICAANQLGAHSDLAYWAERLSAFDRPVTIMSIGAQSDAKDDNIDLPDGTIEFLKVTQKYNSSPNTNICVRGNYSQRILRNYGIESTVIGCPSLFISEDPGLGCHFNISMEDVMKGRISIAAGNPFDNRSKILEPKLLGLLSVYPGNYILQHPWEFLEFCSGDHANLSNAEIDSMLEFIGHKFLNNRHYTKAFLRDKSDFFIDIGHWMKSIRKSSLAIGTRYHGIAIGIQAGVPGCVFTIDSRTEELCETTGVKHISAQKASSLDADDLLVASLWTQDDILFFQENRRQKAGEMIQFLNCNGLNPPAYMNNLLTP